MNINVSARKGRMNREWIATESQIALKIEDIEDGLPSNIKLAYLPNWNMVRLRLTGVQSGDNNIREQVDRIAAQVCDRLGSAVVTTEDQTMAEVVYNVLQKKGKTLSVAESCTGGYISHLMTEIPGASKVFVGSVVSYSNSVKHHQLGVETTLFETVGAVSEQVVTQMATGVRERLQTDYAIAVSGIAGPGGGSDEKPVGTVVIGVASEKETVVKTWHFIGDRMNVIGRASNMAFDMLRHII